MPTMDRSPSRHQKLLLHSNANCSSSILFYEFIILSRRIATQLRSQLFPSKDITQYSAFIHLSLCTYLARNRIFHQSRNSTHVDFKFFSNVLGDLLNIYFFGFIFIVHLCISLATFSPLYPCTCDQLASGK